MTTITVGTYLDLIAEAHVPTVFFMEEDYRFWVNSLLQWEQLSCMRR